MSYSPIASWCQCCGVSEGRLAVPFQFVTNYDLHVLLLQKLPKSNPFDLVNPKVQRFYFNNSSGKLSSWVI